VRQPLSDDLAVSLYVPSTDAMVLLARVFRVTKRTSLAIDTARRALGLLTARYGPESSQLWVCFSWWLSILELG
jgi:hypothetical protein